MMGVLQLSRMAMQYADCVEPWRVSRSCFGTTTTWITSLVTTPRPAEANSVVFGPRPVLVVISNERRLGRREFYGTNEAGRYLVVVTDAADFDGPHVRRDGATHERTRTSSIREEDGER